MSCRRADDVDLASFLVHEDSAALDAFRAHYPGCADCAAEVRVWTDLHARLAAGLTTPTDTHPTPEQLLAFDQHPHTLAAAARQQLAEHLDTCAACRDELRALQTFDFGAVEAAAPVGWGGALRAFATRLRSVVVHPAFAYGLVALLAIVTLRNVFDERSLRPISPGVVALGPKKPDEHARVLASQEPPPTARPPAGSDVGGTGSQPAQAPPAVAKAPAATPPEQAAPPSVLAKKAKPEAADRQAAEGAAEARGVARADLDVMQGAERSKSAERLAEAPRVRQFAPAEAPEQLAATTVLLDPAGGPTLAPLSPGAAAVHLQTAVPEGATAGDELEITVRSADGRRRLSERAPADLTGALVEMTLPPTWLQPGSYRIDLHRLRPNRPAEPISTFELTARQVR